MVFPLSSSITLSFTPSTPKCRFFSTHFGFRFSQARNQENATPFQLKFQCKASKEDFVKIAVDGKDSILASIPADLREKGSDLYNSLVDGKGGLEALLKCIKDQGPDRVSVGLASSLDTVAELELLQAPGLSFLLPEQYLKYPRLTGRAVVALTIVKGDGSSFSPEVGGEPRKTSTVQVVLDGYSAPLTTGNFAKLVTDGAYDGTKLSCINQAIISENDTGTVLP